VALGSRALREALLTLKVYNEDYKKKVGQKRKCRERAEEFLAKVRNLIAGVIHKKKVAHLENSSALKNEEGKKETRKMRNNLSGVKHALSLGLGCCGSEKEELKKREKKSQG